MRANDMLHRISCRQYPSCIGATTLRRLCELNDGCHNNNDLLNLISYDERFRNTKCKTTDLLIFYNVFTKYGGRCCPIAVSSFLCMADTSYGRYCSMAVTSCIVIDEV